MSPEFTTRQAPSSPVRFRDIDQLFRKLEKRFQKIEQRAYQLFEQNGRSDGHELEHWLQAEKELLQPVPVEVEERGNEFVVWADVPGFKPEELEVAVDSFRILISGKSESNKEEKQKGKAVYSEQQSNEISRALTLPSEVLPDKANAVLRDGRLEITIAKAEGNKTTEKKVPVKAA